MNLFANLVRPFASIMLSTALFSFLAASAALGAGGSGLTIDGTEPKASKGGYPAITEKAMREAKEETERAARAAERGEKTGPVELQAPPEKVNESGTKAPVSSAAGDAASKKAVTAAKSVCVKYDDVGGAGKHPYNFRVIDGKLFAGGNLFGPEKPKNAEAKARQHLEFLKKMGANAIILFNVPAGHGTEYRYIEKACAELGMEFFPCRMNSERVPTKAETEKIMALIENGAYIHCNWGCDRTGSVIAKYLVMKKGYGGEEAFRAVITGGSHSGKRGGLKQTPAYKNLIVYFWPSVAAENPEIAKKYGIK